MAKKGLDYFSHDVVYNTPLEVVFSRLGEKSHGILNRIWQHIYKTKGYYMLYNEDELFMIKRSCSDATAEEIKTLFQELLKRNLFDKEIFEEFGVITSERLQKNYIEATKRRKTDLNKLPYLLDGIDPSNKNINIKIEFTSDELESEEWIDVDGFEEYYAISDLGRLLKKETNTITTGTYSSGYLAVHLTNGIDKKTFMIHRLVANAFIPNPENKLFVHHKDHVKQNNKKVNLEWVTHKENSIYYHKYASTNSKHDDYNGDTTTKQSKVKKSKEKKSKEKKSKSEEALPAEINKDLKYVVSLFEEELKRMITNNESTIIDNWIAINEYTKEEIKNALLIAIKRQNTSMPYIQGIMEKERSNNKYPDGFTKLGKPSLEETFGVIDK